MRAVLDSWAVMALLDDEPAADRVDAVIDEGDALMSWINLGEVYYQTMRRRGDARAREALDALRTRIHLETPDEQLVLAASRIKAGGRLSYADAFCVATAQRHDAELWTGDREILDLDAGLTMIDLRSTP